MIKRCFEIAVLGFSVTCLMEICQSSSAFAQLPRHPVAVSGDVTPSPGAIETLSSQMETYTSVVLGSQRHYGLVLPPDYDQHPDQRYPVIFLLHGGHGTETDWLDPHSGDAVSTLAQLYQVGKLPPSIIITPEGSDKRGSSPYWDPEYRDGENGAVSTAIGDELVKLVQQRYRTLPAPNFWAIGGLSSGGWGAVNIGLHHPDHFSVLFSHSGYFEDNSDAENSPMTFIQSVPKSVQQRLRIYLDSGDSDREYAEQSQKFHQVLDQLQIINVFKVFPGGHTWGYWRQHLTDSLSFVGENFRDQFKVAGQSKDP
jgi:enterochelin esterase-like enzyme